MTTTLPYLPIAKVEAAVLDNYATVVLQGRLRQRITTLVKDQLARKATPRPRSAPASRVGSANSTRKKIASST